MNNKLELLVDNLIIASEINKFFIKSEFLLNEGETQESIKEVKKGVELLNYALSNQISNLCKDYSICYTQKEDDESILKLSLALNEFQILCSNLIKIEEGKTFVKKTFSLINRMQCTCPECLKISKEKENENVLTKHEIINALQLCLSKISYLNRKMFE